MAAYRFLQNSKVTEELLLSQLVKKCHQICADKRLLVLCDTTEFNLYNHKERIKDFRGIGSTSNNDILGFFSQNLLAIERDTLLCLGWAGIKIFNRPLKNKPFVRSNGSVPIEKKESYKWLGPCLKSKSNVLKDSSHVLFVMDREADIYEVMERLPDERTDILIRVKHDRIVHRADGVRVKVKEDIRNSKTKGIVSIQVNSDNKKRLARQAECEVKWEQYSVPISKTVFYKKRYKQEITLTAVHIREVKKTVPKGEKPLEWTLWYSQPIENLQQAIEVIGCYKSRWHVEEAHRLLKKKGFNIEATELEKGSSIRKLLLLAMEASIKIMQLKSARDGDTLIPIDAVFTKEEISCLEHLNEQYQGATEKQQNPHPSNTLPWSSWIIARIGGWKGFKSQRPPGTITFQRGYMSFKEIYSGYSISRNLKDVYKR